MEDIVFMKDGSPAVSTKQVADTFKKAHRDVTRALENLDCSEEFRAANFTQSSYKSPQNKTLACYDMTRDGFSFLCMGFTGAKSAAWKERYIEAFNKMEAYIKKESSDLTLMESINSVSKQLDNLAAAGSSWGRTGTEIKRRKREATQELEVLIASAQLRLGI